MAVSRQRRGWLPRIADLKRLAPWQSFHADRVLLPSPDDATPEEIGKRRPKLTAIVCPHRSRFHLALHHLLLLLRQAPLKRVEKPSFGISLRLLLLWM
ncbi:hypothetical protein OPV22_011227 [Ensete ventricosum]|uniref:Uncharacterized protein n=1 Tax=Ensete ventricosum TaxID=4639 RepID=A0AAV8Q4S3_ENSVE|nr:hypothetical protein OPV22_011227 [Ensete ventricosum]